MKDRLIDRALAALDKTLEAFGKAEDVARDNWKPFVAGALVGAIAALVAK